MKAERSAYRAKTERAPLDRYDTPRAAVMALLRELPGLGGNTLLDPCCGNGEMAKEVGRRFERVVTSDIDPSVKATIHRDLRRRSLWESVRPDWTVTNPPFSLVGEALSLALDYSRSGVALFVRLSVLEVCKGREVIEIIPPTRIIVLPRIKFRGAGSDRVTCAWMVWDLSAPQSAIRCVGRESFRSLDEQVAA